MVRYSITIENAGGDSAYTRVVVALPQGYFIAANGDCAAAAPSGSRLVWYEGAFSAGARKECRLNILTHPDAVGTIATLAVEITTPPSGYFRFEARPTLAAPPNSNVLYVGPFGITTAGLMTLAILALMVVGAAGLARKRWRDRESMRASIGAWIAIAASVGFLLYFASLARDDFRSYADYQETSCFLVGSSIRAFEGSSMNSGSSTYAPEFAVRYDVFGAETYSVVSSPATTVSVGWIGSSQKAIERLAVGSSQPCWFDPKDVKTVLLERGPGGAYFFALLPLLVLALASWWLRKV